MFEFPGSYLTPIVCVVVTLSLLSMILSADLFGYGATNIFAYHGAFMVVGVVLLMPLAALSYSFDFGSWANKRFPTRASRRVLHGTLNLLAFFFVVLGFLVAFAYHQAYPRSPAAISGVSTHLPFNLPELYSPKARSAHVVLGWVTLAGTVLLTLSGLYKFVQAHKDDKASLENSRSQQQGLGTVTLERTKVFTLHGKVGPFVWTCGLLCICLAGFFEYQEKLYKAPGTTWTIGEAVLVWVSIAVLFVLVSAHFIVGSKKHIKESKDVTDEAARGLLQ